VWLGISVEQFDRRENPTVDAIAALVDLLLDPGGLHRMRPFRRTDPGQRRDLATSDRRHRRDAGADRAAVDLHRAGAALAETTTEPWIVESKVVAQDVEQ